MASPNASHDTSASDFMDSKNGEDGEASLSSHTSISLTSKSELNFKSRDASQLSQSSQSVSINQSQTKLSQRLSQVIKCLLSICFASHTQFLY